MSARRYSLDPLVSLMGVTYAEAARRLGLRAGSINHYRSPGMRHELADRAACTAGYHPYVVWPEMAEHDLADAETAAMSTCAECDGRFWPAFRKPHQRYCSQRCRSRANKRRERATEQGAELNRLRRRRYYAENGAYERTRERRTYHEKRARRAA